jgi:hypothetical protein
VNNINSIRTVGQVREYYEKNLAPATKPNISVDERNSILRKTTMADLRYLYRIVFGIPLAGNWKKIDVVYQIRDYFENDKRTRDLTKMLY